ncbi:hypothetical protein NHQ30_001213 [Ciborinia camelliae]|nr:hypothetical protein NHQ30_001213 [Ciborinia camelliae]
MTLSLTPFSTLTISCHLIPHHFHIPNTSIQNHPLLIYHSCFPPLTPPSAIEDHLEHVGVVQPSWRYTMYDVAHFHATTHEVLCVFSGRARLCFGHPSNLGKIEIEVQAGDVIIVPAGVSHQLLHDFTGHFEMVGSYPKGKSWDMCYGTGEEEELERVRGIGELGWFERDPLYGDEGPLDGS